MNNRDIVILFGAGASYGPGHVLPQAPPLGVNLYDALAAQYPKDWGSESHLGKMWASQLRDDFERTMYEEVLPKVSSLPLLEWHRRVAEFFATYRVDGSGQDMYSLLLSGLRTTGLVGQVTFGSLNYDCLLEQAMLGLQLTTDYTLKALASQGSVPVAKIHGSCNFIAGDLSWKRAFIITNPNAAIECPLNALSLQNLEGLLRQKFAAYEQAFFPVLSITLQTSPQ